MTYQSYQRLALTVAVLLCACTSETLEPSAGATFAVAALTEAPTCSADELSWGATDGTCDGEWSYQVRESCTTRDPSCGTRCTQYKECSNWAFGHTYTGGPTKTLDPVDIGEFSRSEKFDDPGCTGWRCTKPVYFPDTERAAAECQRRARSSISTQKLYWRGLGREQRDKIAVKSATAKSRLVGNKYHFTCEITLEAPIAKRAEDTSYCRAKGKGPGCLCPSTPSHCAASEYKACEGRHQSCAVAQDVHLSATGLNRRGLADEARASFEQDGPAGDRTDDALVSTSTKCLTCEHLPLPTTDRNNESRANAMFDCLEASLDVAPADTSLEIERRMQRLYETWGQNLSVEHREVAAVAYTIPNPESESCGASVVGPTGADASCGGFAQLRADVIRCQRLNHESVSTRLVADEVEGCVEALAQTTSVAAAECGFGDAELQSKLRKTVTSLVAKQMAAIADSTVTSAGSKDLRDLAHQLHLMNAWWYAALKSVETVADVAYRDAQKELDGSLEYLSGLFWQYLEQRDDKYGELTAALDPKDGSDVDSSAIVGALESLSNVGRATRQSVVRVLFTDYLGEEGPAAGAVLATVLGQALEADYQRARDVSMIYDFACELQACRQDNVDRPLPRYWTVFAAMNTPETLKDALSTLALDGWTDVFRGVAARPQLLASAVNAVEEGRELELTRGTAFARILAESESYHRAFATYGRFSADGDRVLQTGVDPEDRAQIIRHMNQVSEAFTRDVEARNARMIASAQSLASAASVAQRQAEVADEILQNAETDSYLVNQIAAFGQAGDDADAEFGDLVDAYERIKDSLSEQTLVANATQSLQLELSGANAPQTGRDLEDAAYSRMSAGSLFGLKKGQLVSLSTAGSYAPTCALRGSAFLSPKGGPAAPPAVGAAGCGPTGFSMAYSNGSYEAYSNSESASRTESETVGVRGEVCLTSGTVAQAYGVDARACAYASAEVRQSFDISEQSTTGGQTRLDASFAAGIRLPNTPMPFAPVGALVAVLTVPGSEQPIDMQVVQGPSFALLVPADADLHLVVNDVRDEDCVADASLRMSVQGQAYTPVGSMAPAILDAMLVVLSDIESHVDTVSRQGELLASEHTARRSAALLALQNALPEGVAAQSIPAPLRGLFDAFVDKEIAGLERAAKIAGLERRLSILRAESAGLERAKASLAQQGGLSGVVTSLLLETMDNNQVRASAGRLLRQTQDYLLPILELWYPSVGDSDGLTDQLTALRDLSFSAKLHEQADVVRASLKAVLDALSEAQLGSGNDSDNGGTPSLRTVVMSYPNPAFDGGDFGDDFGDDDFSGDTSRWDAVDPLAVEDFWDDLYRIMQGDASKGTEVHFRVRPEDFYSAQNGNGDKLFCDRVAPVVRRMYMYVTRPGRGLDGASNTAKRSLRIEAPRTQVFTTEAGPVDYRQANGLATRLEMGVLSGDSSDATRVLRDFGWDLGAAGVSPLGTFTVDLAPYLGELHRIGIDGQTPEVLFMMELDSRESTTILDYVGSCQ